MSATGVLNVLVVDDETNVRKTLAMCLETDGYHVVAVSNAQDARAEAARQSFDVAFVDLRLGLTLGSDLIPDLLAASPWMRVVIITAHGTIDNAVEMMKRGASDYLTKPFTPAQVKQVVERAARRYSRGDQNLEIASKNPAMQRAINLARQVASSNTTVLLRGESGTGKGLLAKAIHGWSNRAEKAFATVSCPSLSPQLLESELFGHVKGAFTGAIRDNPGRVATADGGTIFLDEIGDLPLSLQPKLLRFVQEREYERVGESQTRRADVRMIAATNVDLEVAVRDGKFREDLLYRIQVVQIDLPPLRERGEDNADLAAQFLAELRPAQSIVGGFSQEAMAALKRYAWPGNIRELRNVIERALVLCRGEQIGIEHLPSNIVKNSTLAEEIELGDDVPLDQLEELHIRRVLAKSKSLDQAADVLGIDTATLWRRRKKYGI